MVTGTLKFVFVDLLPYKFWYITAAAAFWIIYIAIRAVTTERILAYWGFSKQSFGITFRKLLPFAAAAIAGCVVYGLLKDTLRLHWHLVPTLLLYPAWGVLQQFMIVALIAGNLQHLEKRSVPNLATIIITSIIFASVHFPSLYLVAATFILAILYTKIYLQHRNLWVLGLFHGWLGAFFYFFVLGRDAWAEVFTKY